MDMTRRGFVGAAFAAGVWGGSQLAATAADAINCVPPLLKFGVVSDVHVRLAADGRSLAAGYETDTLEKTFAYFRDQGVDAVMIAGDMADLGLTRELKAVADAWFKVFPNDRAPDGRTVERLFSVTNYVRYIGIALIVLLVFISLVFINNTIRLAIMARRKEIAIMRLVGASNGFIRGPFLMEGALHAVIGALLAAGCLELLRHLALPRLQASLAFLPIGIDGNTFLLIYLILLAAGLVIGLIGSAFAMRRYLKV